MRVKLFKRPIYKLRKSSSALTHVHNPARRSTLSWVLGQVRLPLGSIWAFICNSRLNPRVHLSETRGGQAAILISLLSPRGGEWRGGEEQDGDISTALQCIIDIGSPPNWLWSLYSATKGGKNTSKVVVVGEDGSIYFSDIFYVLTHHNIKHKVALVTQALHLQVKLFFHHVHS